MRVRTVKRSAFSFVLLLTLVLFYTGTTFVIGSQELEFEIIDYGFTSWYSEETYLVARTSTQFAEIWRKHAGPDATELLTPEINFNEKIVLCAFLGQLPTTGYNIAVERIRVEDDQLHVEIVKSSPPEDLVLAQVLTFPYVFASIEKNDIDIVFDVTEQDGTKIETIIPEISSTFYNFILFATLSSLLYGLVRTKSLKRYSKTRIYET